MSCEVFTCNKNAEIYIATPIGVMGFCLDHHLQIMENLDNAERVAEMLWESDGEMVIIDTFDEMKKRLKPEFLKLTTDALMLTDGKCCVCGKPAVCTGAGYKPFCEECYGFPRNVLKCALRE